MGLRPPDRGSGRLTPLLSLGHPLPWKKDIIFAPQDRHFSSCEDWDRTQPCSLSYRMWALRRTPLAAQFPSQTPTRGGFPQPWGPRLANPQAGGVATLTKAPAHHVSPHGLTQAGPTHFSPRASLSGSQNFVPIWASATQWTLGPWGLLTLPTSNQPGLCLASPQTSSSRHIPLLPRASYRLARRPLTQCVTRGQPRALWLCQFKVSCCLLG